MAGTERLTDTLKSRGIRMTPQRAIILAAIEQMSGHITAEEIFESVQQVNSYINLATVYRTLDLLRELDLVTEADMGTGAMHYALHTHGTHHHAICRTCGRSIEFSDGLIESLARDLRACYRFIADANHTVIFGWCEGCLIDSHPTAS